MKLGLGGSRNHSAASVLSALVSLGVFVWAVYKNFAIGIHASDTKTTGAPDQIVWLWLFASFAVLVASTIALVVMLHRRSITRR